MQSESVVQSSSISSLKPKKFTCDIGEFLMHLRYVPFDKSKKNQLVSTQTDKLAIKIINAKDKANFCIFQCDNSSIPMPLLLYMQSVNEIFEYIKSSPSLIQIAKNSEIGSKNLKINIKVVVCKKEKICPISTKYVQGSKFQSLQNQKIIITHQHGNLLKKKINQKQQHLQTLINRQVNLDQETLRKDEEIILLEKQNKELKQLIKELQKKKVQKQKQKIEKIPQKSVIISKQTALKPMNESALFKHVENHNGKKNLFLKGKGVGDDDIKKMIFYDWTSIEIISMGGNKITDLGLRNLMKIQWPSVNNLYLFSNPITDITCISPQVQNKLEILSVYENNLNLASCQFILKNPWPFLTELYISFDKKINEKCCQMIMKSNFKTFPSLKKLHLSEQFGISVDLRTKMQVVANTKNIKLSFGEVSLIDPNCQIY